MAAVLVRFIWCCPPRTPSSLSQQSSSSSSSLNSSISCSSSNSSLKSLFYIQKQQSSSRFNFPLSSSTIETPEIQTPEIEEEEEEEEEEGEEICSRKLIAQNVPWSSSADDIRQLFQIHGTVIDVQLSMHNKTRNRGLAFVTMASPQEALAALQNLQSYEFEGRSLNINYARPQKKKSSPDQPKTPSVYNLFVANLSYEARSKDLRNFFEDGGWTVYTAEVIFQEDVKMSAGYGFVSFNSKEDADAALSGFQGKMFMGRSIRLARSKRFERHEAKTRGPEVASEIDNVE